MATATPGRQPAPTTGLQASIEALGNQIFDRMEGAAVPLFSATGVYARLMDWAMKDEAFKIRLFQFVDTLPALRTNAAVVRSLQEYLGDAAVELSPLLRGGLAAAGMAAPVVGPAVRANIAALARQFIAGADPGELCATVRTLHARGAAATVDLLGEAVVGDAEAATYARRNLEALDALAAALPGLGPPCASDLGPGGPLPRINLSMKMSALDARIDPATPEESIGRLVERLRPILRRAAACGALVNLDMESHRLKDLVLRLFKTLLEDREFSSGPALGIALQAYLRDAMDDLDDLVAWARRLGRRFSVRLVKGAYWDCETIVARQRGWPVPVWSHKAESDLAFERMTERLLDHVDVVSPAFGTHNIRSVAHAVVQAGLRGIDRRTLEFQMLFGMAEPVKRSLLDLGLRVREYCPCGDLLPGMAYFVRRLLENTSNEGFLRRTFVERTDRAALLADPARLVPPAPRPAVQAAGRFANEPVLDLARERERARFAQALAEVRRHLGRAYPPIIDGRPIATSGFIDSVNPAAPAEVVGRAGRATAADAEAAVAASVRSQPAWARVPAAERAAVLERAAAIMRAHRLELAAIEVLEVGKPWAEADADVTEAIDFCVYYAREMRRLGGFHPNVQVPGETSVTHYLPCGVAAVIAPWNFPLAILCGMTAAALVTGNAVVVKPAGQSPVIAARLHDILIEAGVPPGVLHFVPGPGSEVGEHLISHPRVDVIAFTGSREVGLHLWQTAARCAPGQAGLKKVVCEMGGKNALVIDADADLDEAVPAAVYAAFGYSGQKCSALSRLVVLQDNYDRCLERLAACADTFTVDFPERPRAKTGPVVDRTAQRRILGVIDEARRCATCRWQGTVPPGDGCWVPPTIFTGVPRDSRLAREEIFGPVLAVFKARDLGEAIAIANDSEFALTGGIFSRSPSSIERIKSELVAGNVYVNRSITGALVGRHPFGGFKMSGGGTKAGGPGYLLHFMVPRSIAENVLRRGFAPEVET
jgi:RHH-type proline utilization regulon transcriptional repressor/proline dehydrogenase/delta 1-pyrroline-5-carboxylate dehydrogenase